MNWKCAIAAMVLLTLAAPAVAQQASPYDMTYKMRGGAEAPLYGGMSTSSGKIMDLPGNASGIILRWCRDEIPFGTWQFGTLKQQQAILDDRWCEVSYKGKVGNVEGSAITPE